eukprot:gb/GEZN01004260.1/.p1 GENE.gb/GEZN01004260.1/~~gb/GEZN01004260.1/.p1  ORF type:complete len:422 (+),score=-13.06 gb/GEZN01004260.1/:465-1730(+)
MAEANRLCALANEAQPSDEQRLDLTGLRCFTIDDPGTQELDDALSYEQDQDGNEWIWIHIADPDRLVFPGSDLDLEAKQRATSLYLASGGLPMFPMELAAGSLSLKQGQRCAAVSTAILLDNCGEVVKIILQRSWIYPTYRLTYEDGDELIELAPNGDEELSHLTRLMSLRRGWRQRQGALELEKSEGKFCQDGETIGLEIIETSCARQMVAESMILLGATLADLGKRKNIVLPYRSQPSAELPLTIELNTLPEGPVRHTAIKRCLSRGLLGTKAAPHFSLGLSCYVQATSPIRRYGDLIVQRQLLNYQRGKDLLSEGDILNLTQSIDIATKEATQIAREDQRHWQQVWFEQHRCQQWQAQFLRWLRVQDHIGLVYIDSIALELAVVCKQDSSPGDSIITIVESVDSSIGHLTLRAIASPC